VVSCWLQGTSSGVGRQEGGACGGVGFCSWGLCSSCLCSFLLSPFDQFSLLFDSLNTKFFYSLICKGADLNSHQCSESNSHPGTFILFLFFFIILFPLYLFILSFILYCILVYFYIYSFFVRQCVVYLKLFLFFFMFFWCLLI